MFFPGKAGVSGKVSASLDTHLLQEPAGYDGQELPFAWITHTGDAFGPGSSSFLADMSHRLQTESMSELQEERPALYRKHPNNSALVASSVWQKHCTQKAFVASAKLVLLLSSDIKVRWDQDICLKASWHRQQ